MKSRRSKALAEVGISEALQTLPLFDEPYLQMQVMNLDVVDEFLRNQETNLLAEYMELERTPVPTAVFVSALSQLWIFGLYELLRTWRQRATDVLRWAKNFRLSPVVEQGTCLAAKEREIVRRSAALSGAAGFHWPAYERAAKDEDFVRVLREAIDRTERLFRRIEALRMSLAKHELPGLKGSFAMAPGYGRIDMSDGSIYWLVVLKGNEVDTLSRRRIAEDCGRLGWGNTAVILPEGVQEKLKRIPDFSYGVKRVAVVLDSGIEYTGVHVAWRKEILRVGGHETVPFDAKRVADVRHDPLKSEEQAI